MIKTITSVSGQTMYDLCLMTYGSFDLLIKFCSDNGVNDVNYVPFTPKNFVYDTGLTTDQKTNNYVYATANIQDSGIGGGVYDDAYSSANG